MSFQCDFVPRLSFNTVTARTSASLSACATPARRYRALKSATLFADKSAATATGCAPAPLVVSGIATILWNTNETSTLNFRISTNPLGGSIELGGRVTKGPLSGSWIIAAPAVVAQYGFCLLGGVKSFSASLGTDTFEH